MGFWAWFWIWTFLSLAALAVFMLIGISLFHRAKEVLHQVGRIAKTAEPLMAALDAKADVAMPESALLKPTAELDAKRRAFLKNKTKKRAVRQRSLITALKRIDPDESRFTNV
jgi:hypothetical protein